MKIFLEVLKYLPFEGSKKIIDYPEHKVDFLNNVVTNYYMIDGRVEETIDFAR